MRRGVLAGAAIAPLVAPILYTAFVMLFVPDTTPKQERTWEVALLTLVVAFIPLSYILCFAFGAPLIQLLRRKGKLSLPWITSGAALTGAVAFVFLLGVLTLFGTQVQWGALLWRDGAWFFGTGAMLGAVTGAVFGLMSGGGLSNRK